MLFFGDLRPVAIFEGRLRYASVEENNKKTNALS
jgi:hypothetical protein